MEDPLRLLSASVEDLKASVRALEARVAALAGRSLFATNAVRGVFEIASLDGFSAHADQRELIEWVLRLDPLPRTIFLVHGEPEPAETLAALLRERTGATVHVPSPGEEFDLWN